MGWYQWHWNHKKFMLEKSPTLRKVNLVRLIAMKMIIFSKWLICFQFEVTMLFTSFIKVSSFECKLFKRVVLNLTICLLSKVMIYFTHPWIKVHLLSENSSRELFWIQYPISYPKSWFISQVIKWKFPRYYSKLKNW